MTAQEQYELLKGVPGIVWKKSENYQKAYKLVPFGFEAPDEWLALDDDNEAL